MATRAPCRRGARRNPLPAAPALALVTTLAALASCSEDELAPQIAVIEIVPLPEGGQRVLSGEPAGIDMGKVPLLGSATARFRVDNVGGAVLQISEAQVHSSSGGIFRVERWPSRVEAHNREDEGGELVVSFAPEADALPGEAVIILSSNAGSTGQDSTFVRVQGVGLFVGEPRLTVCYGGKCYPEPGDCADDGNGKSVCALEPLGFGNVGLGGSASQAVRLINAPPADTCLPPPGSPPCTRVCELVVDRDPQAHDVGVGLSPGDAGFSLAGNTEVPFTIDVSNPSCGVSNEVRMLVGFEAGAEEGEATALLVIETSDPAARVIEIPLLAATREAPVAVVEFVPCDAAHPPPMCTNPEELTPLDRVYLDGSKSYDVRDPADPSLVVGYQWKVLEHPSGANPDDFDLQGDGSPAASMWLPLAGRYVVRLQVTNDLGIQSGVSPTSDITFTAVPASRMHLQLVWDSPTNDQDLHLVFASQADLVCDPSTDCYWSNCMQACVDDPECSPPVWFDTDPPLALANPHLDIDDTQGLGPENINIDRPGAGRYGVYVHYYGLVDILDVPTSDTVRIYLDGQLRAEYRRTLRRNDLWRVADIEWLADGTAVVTPAASDGTGPGAVKEMLSCREPFDFEGE